ncbi:unnamed protein product [Closterium sp. NIES-64]|nr:unnamed protein product [Closterium sp. NIES-64]
MRENLAYLLDQRLYESAEILGSFLVSAAAPGSDVPAISRAENLVLYADALFGRQEFRRALNLYRQAQQLCKVAGHAGGSSRTVPGSPATVAGTVASAGLGTPAQSGGYRGACVGGAGGGGGGVVGGMGGGGASMVALDTDVGKAEVRLRVAECYVALKEVKPALTELEAVPHRLRSLRLNLLLARLYRSSSYDRAALTAYKECLRQCPFAMEAVTAVGQLGLSAKETCALLPQQEPLPCTPSSRGGSKAGATGEVHESCKWLQKYVEAQAHRAANENAACVDEYQQLLTRFPSNVHLHLYMGQVEASQGRNEEAMLHYQKARTLDPFNVACMDDYALLLLSRRSPSASSALSLPNLQVDASVGGGGAAGGAGGAGGAELRRLTAEMVGVGAGRVEAWVVAAALWMSRGERGSALAYVDKALQLDDHHFPALLAKGAILLQTERAESAAVASAAAAIFRRAYTQKQDLRVFQGLVRAYLRIPKLKEAIAAAREAVKAFPNSASALSLLGEVYLQHGDSRDKARKVFEAALRMDGRCGAAVTGLADAHSMDGRHSAAVDVLERHLAVDAADWIHVKLGFVHMAANRLPDALHHLQTALSINPTNENAKRGLNRIDRLLKGGDGDDEEEETSTQYGTGSPLFE